MQQRDKNRTAVKFTGVSKAYRLGSTQNSLREAINFAGKRIFSRQKRGENNQTLWALRDINLEIERGSSLGVIGPNGAGKTTMLKLLSRVTVPTEGIIRRTGRISALIELGAGFHPDLTGKDNIYLSAALLGMTRQEIESKFEAIVEFSELKRFLDTPVKRYSSGMYARLGFAVAAHVDPDILLTDEVLAVGDVAFQSKCYRRMAELKERGTTIIFVTHAMPTMRRLCDRTILLYRGQIHADGDPADVIETYLGDDDFASNLSDKVETTSIASTRKIDACDRLMRIEDVRFLDENGETVTACKTGDSLTIRVIFSAVEVIRDISITIKVRGLDGALYDGFNSAWDGCKPSTVLGRGKMDVTINPLCLLDGKYSISVMLSDEAGLTVYDWHSRRYRLRVLGGAAASSHGMIYMPHKWSSNNDTA